MDYAIAGIDRDIGRRVHALRTAAAMTLDGLAERAGVSRAMLSRIERGESSPTAQLLNRVCAGLGVTLSALFASAKEPASPLSPRSGQSVWRDPGSGYVRRVISSPGGARAEIVEVAFPAGATVTFDSQRLADTDQQVWILDGRMELTVGEALHRLGRGDCLTVRLDQPIRFHNPGKRAARYVVVLTRMVVRP